MIVLLIDGACSCKQQRTDSHIHHSICIFTQDITTDKTATCACFSCALQIIEKYNTQMAGMRAEIERMQPNLKSVEQFASAQVRNCNATRSTACI
jgi:hypothetical protein